MTEAREISLAAIVGGGYKDMWETRKRYVVCKGSRGSKKSKTTALWIIHNLLKYPLANVLCVRKYGVTIRDSQYSDLRWAIERFGFADRFKFTYSPLEITYIPTGQKILFRGLDDGMKVTSISVPIGCLCWVWVEESFELNNEDDFNKLDMSIRGVMPAGYFKRIMLTFNPWSENHWLKKRFFDTPSANVFTKTTTYKVNEWLDDSDKAIFEEMKRNNPRRYAIEGEGQWGIADGLIYENFEIADFDIDALRAKAGTTAVFGLDFGFTDPTAFTAAIVDNDDKKIYVFDEFYKKGITNQEIADLLIDMGYSNQRIICDSAEPKSIYELRQREIDAKPSRKGRDSVLHGIQQLQNFKFIISPKCAEFQREISNYCWEKDKSGKSIDRPDHEFSHGMDSIRYAVCYYLRGGMSFE